MASLGRFHALAIDHRRQWRGLPADPNAIRLHQLVLEALKLTGIPQLRKTSGEPRAMVGSCQVEGAMDSLLAAGGMPFITPSSWHRASLDTASYRHRCLAGQLCTASAHFWGTHPGVDDPASSAMHGFFPLSGRTFHLS
jgi:hypothetical protein